MQATTRISDTYCLNMQSIGVRVCILNKGVEIPYNYWHHKYEYNRFNGMVNGYPESVFINSFLQGWDSNPEYE